MRIYDLVLVIKTTLSENERKKFLETVKGWFKDLKVTKEDLLGQKVLSYPIKREAAGYYVRISFEGQNISPDLNRRLLQNENLLRHLVIRRK